MHLQPGFQASDLDGEPAQEGGNILVRAQRTILHFLQQGFCQKSGFVQREVIREIGICLARDIDGEQKGLVNAERQACLAQDGLQR